MNWYPDKHLCHHCTHGISSLPSSQNSQIHKTIDSFPSSTMKVSLYTGNFQVSTNLISSYSVNKVFDGFNIIFVPSISFVKPCIRHFLICLIYNFMHVPCKLRLLYSEPISPVFLEILFLCSWLLCFVDVVCLFCSFFYSIVAFRDALNLTRIICMITILKLSTELCGLHSKFYFIFY